MTTIETIRGEIERRITDNTFGAKLELIDILAWLDTLEEKPVDLENDAVMYCFDKGINLSPKDASEFALHFYELGRNAK